MLKKLIFSPLLLCSLAVSAQTVGELCELKSQQNNCASVTHFLNKPAEFESEMEQYKACASAKFDLYKAEKNCEFDSYFEQANKNFATYKNKVAKVWDKPTFSSKKSWVSYSPSLEIKREVNFEKNVILVTTINGGENSVETMKEKIISTSSLTVEQAQKADPYTAELIKVVKTKQLSKKPLLPISANKKLKKAEQEELLNNIQVSRLRDSKGNKVTVVEAKFPKSWINRKEQRFIEPIQQQAKRFTLDPDLILAVIKTESNFSPTAISHIPAFGLMQIVPTSAGFDITEYLEGEQRKLTKEYLFVPEKNIETGSTYLHLLKSRYFKGIDNVKSKQYCMIAAYNGGMGAIYKIFGNGSRKQAIKTINNLSSDTVYNKILAHHYAEETRNYLRRVSTAQSQYSNNI